jgi:class 3 adenylate cyclase
MTPLVLLLFGVAMVVLIWMLWRQRRGSAALRRQLELAAAELQQLQQACARLAPAGVVDRMIADGLHGAAELPAERKVVTALFSDLVGFTAMSEKLEPTVLARILDGYFQRVSDAVHAHSGHVSTWLGDGMLAYFGALRPNPWQCADAVRAALAMCAAIREYNVELARDGLPPLALGIGIHRGPGLAGMIGSRERREYGFVGRTVNLAARVQSLTRTHGVEILVTEPVCAELGDTFRLQAMPPERVKGIDAPVATWAVLGGSEALRPPGREERASPAAG